MRPSLRRRPRRTLPRSCIRGDVPSPLRCNPLRNQRQATEMGERHHSRGLPLPGETDLPEHDLLAAIEHSAAKTFATRTSPDSVEIDRLARQPLDVLERQFKLAKTTEASAKAAGLDDPATAAYALDRALLTRSHLAVGQRVRALDRDNVGTVIQLDDKNGQADILFAANDGTTAERTLPLANLKLIDHPAAVELTPNAHAWLAEQQAAVSDSEREWNQYLIERGLQPGQAALLRNAIDARQTLLSNQLHAASPDWLTWWIGTRLADPSGATVWDDTITEIATLRDRHRIHTDEPGLGPIPAADAAQAEWFAAMAKILAQRTWLTDRNPRAAAIEFTLLNKAEIKSRLAELQGKFAGAPTVTAETLRGLIDGQLSSGEVQRAVNDELTRPNERSRWVLANWPYIVEHQELVHLLAEPEPLAARPRVDEVLRQLCAALIPVTETEHRSLGELRSLLAVCDPGRRLQELTTDLVSVSDNIANIQSLLADGVSRTTTALLATEVAVLNERHALLTFEIQSEQKSASERRWSPSNVSLLRTAIEVRTAAILKAAVTDRPTWLVGRLNALDEAGSLSQLTPGRASAHRSARLGTRRPPWHPDTTT